MILYRMIATQMRECRHSLSLAVCSWRIIAKDPIKPLKSLVFE